MYRVGSYKDTGVGQDTCGGWELNRQYTQFNPGMPGIGGKQFPFITCSFRRPFDLPATSGLQKLEE